MSSRPISIVIEENEKLGAIAGEVKRLWDRAEKNIKVASSAGKAAVQDAIAIGEKLIEAKELIGHGRWLRWFNHNFRGRSYETGMRYIRLAKLSRVTDLNKAEGLRTAYIALGILEKPQVSVNKEAGTITITLPLALGMLKPMHRLTDNVPKLLALPRSDQVKLRRELDPVVELHAQLAS